MKTLNLQDAAELLMIHPTTLLVKAKAGEIPGAKPGKCWVFIDVDLLDWLRSQYTYRPRESVDNQTGESLCSLKDQQAVIGIINSPLKEKLYTEALEPATKKKRRK
ncbi:MULTISPECIES: helix-turn-helix domain-containing protein [Methylomonas]|uniref:helix-turn-helix domain-containing protein n=1 Tax=Methylomonas TaxID=416 RepID=UPI0009EB08F5